MATTSATFDIDAYVYVTPADHAWQNDVPRRQYAHLPAEDACGFWINTPDGTIWAPGDSRLIPEHHLTMPAPDALLFDFSDSEWHFGLAGAADGERLPDTPLLLHHWGSVDAPDFTPFNGDPRACTARWRTPSASMSSPRASPTDCDERRRLALGAGSARSPGSGSES